MAGDVRTIEAFDSARKRLFPVEIWRPSDDRRPLPLILYSHPSGAGRRAATFLCRHLADHGYVVAAMDHSEVVAPELARRDGETAAQLQTRIDDWIDSRVPDIRFLLDHLLEHEANIDRDRIGIVGHSFGGWTALAATGADRRIRSAVALAPAGSSNPRPGILPVKLDFAWGREVPTLFIFAENDTSLPLDGMFELFARAPEPKRMAILHRADHLHFMDGVEEAHERVRAMKLRPELEAMQKEMRPVAELTSGDEAHRFIRDLTLAHFDATLQRGSGQ